MKNKVFSFVLAFILVFTLVSCKDDKKEVSSISVITSTVPTEGVELDELDNVISNIMIKAKWSNGDEESFVLKKSMISNYNELLVSGEHTVNINYNGKSTSIKLTILPKSGNYQVNVIYPDGSPVTGSVFVQWCKGDLCYTPVIVNNQGKASMDLDDGEYIVHLIEDSVPEGYTYNPNIYTATATNKSLTIQLIKVSELGSGNGEQTNPYILSTGCYELTFEEIKNAGIKYYSFTAPKSGKFEIISLAVDSSTPSVDPYLGFLGQGTEPDVSGNIKDMLNFKYEFTAVEGSTYIFMIMVSSANSLPTSFHLQIIEK